MACLQYLQKFGWNFSTEGYQLISNDDTLKDADLIAKNACDIDIKDYGTPVLPKDLDALSAPIVLQIQKLRNIGAPKSNETSGAAPRLLKLTLTDGFSTCQALELEPVSKLDIIKTAPGSKILFKSIQTLGSYILITNSNATLLGGHVAALIERWQLSKLSITKHARGGSDGPPSWVSFGQKVSQPVIADQNFRSLEPVKGKEQNCNEFEVQREEAIAEAAQGAVRKTFGGGSSKTLPPVRENQRFNNKRQSNRGDKPQTDRTKPDRKKGPKERDSPEVNVKPTGKISLFAFLEDKLPTPDVKVETENNKQMRPSYAEKYDASLRHKEPVKKNNSKEKVESKDRSKTEKAPRFQRYQNNIEHITNKANELSLSEPKPKPPNNTGYNKPYTNPRPQSGYVPRGGGKYNNKYQGNNYCNDNRNYPKDNFDKLPPSTNNNFKPTEQRNYQEKQLNELSLQKKVSTPNQWQWNIGDRCMAKYWEDNQYYNASVTNVTPKTCVVQFNDYGNFEEVLKADCIPVAPSVQPPPQSNNRQYTGSLIFRRGGSSSQYKDDRSYNSPRN